MLLMCTSFDHIKFVKLCLGQPHNGNFSSRGGVSDKPFQASIYQSKASYKSCPFGKITLLEILMDFPAKKMTPLIVAERLPGWEIFDENPC